MNDWNIQSRAHGCQLCQKHFADKEHYHTVLFEQQGLLQRLDACEPCWTSQQAELISNRPGIVSSWQGTYEAPPAAPPDAIQKESAETLLRKLIETNDEKYGAACYILAVMLERKRLLKVKEQIKRDGKRIFLYEQPKTGDLFTITDPDLQLNQLDDVQRQVAMLLETGIPNETGASVPSLAETPEARLAPPEEPATSHS